MRRFCVAALSGLSLLAASWAAAQEPDEAKLTEITEKYAPASYALLREALSIPNNALFPEQVEENMQWAERVFKERGFETTRLETARSPLVLAERKVQDPSRTVLIYLQVDGQPVDPSAWDQESPYVPVLKEPHDGGWREIPWSSLETGFNPDWRFYARSAADAKGPMVMLLTALDALDGEGLEMSYDLKVIMDFEEELGSPNLPAALDVHRDALAADCLLIYDGPRHPNNRPTLTFGARGIVDAKIVVYGPRFAQHSGHYGNYAPNPALRLTQLLASMKDDDGRVTIPGFYDGIELSDEMRAILRKTPDDEEEIRRQLGIAAADKVAPTLQEAIQYPSLNIRGLGSGWIDEQVRTIIPTSATAELDVRVVPETTAERLMQLIKAHIEAQGYHVIGDREPTDEERMKYPRIATYTYKAFYDAFRTPYDSEVGVWLQSALTRAFGEEPVLIQMAGGSIPISPFVVKLGLPAVSVPPANIDNNQHSPNENIRLGNFVEGIRTYLAILTERFD